MRLPDVNALLNGAATVLLCCGWIAVRRKRIGLHKACMLSAFAVSVAFLACYLVHHARVGHVEFKGTGWIRPVYYAILVPHILLAFAIVPMALRTLWLAWKGELERHRRLARWTLPLWLYVSVTGVLIYAMLYF